MTPIFTPQAINAVFASSNLAALRTMLYQGLDPNSCIPVRRNKNSPMEPIPLVFHTTFQRWKAATKLLVGQKLKDSLEFQGQPLVSELIERNDPDSFNELLSKGTLPLEHLNHAFRACIHLHFSAPEQAIYFMGLLIHHDIDFHHPSIEELIEERKLYRLLETMESLQQQKTMMNILPQSVKESEKVKRL